MKRTILAITFCLVISETFAQNIFSSAQKINISETSLQWVNLSDRVIEDKENNKVYIGFLEGQEELILQANIEAYSSDKESGGNIVNNLDASILFPVPGGPIIKTL